jgi:hypothetical protein
MEKIQVKIEPLKWPDDPKEKEKLIHQMMEEGRAGSQKEVEELLRIMEGAKKSPPSDFLIGKAA